MTKDEFIKTALKCGYGCQKTVEKYTDEDTGLEPEEIPHWISASERLPEELGHYLAVVKRIAPDELGGNETRIRIMRWLGEDWQYARHIPEWINQKITETVTHWMPLPAVPKEEK